MGLFFLRWSVLCPCFLAWSPPRPLRMALEPKVQQESPSKKTFGALRLRACSISQGDEDGRRSPFFGTRRFDDATRRALEMATSSTLRAVALGGMRPEVSSLSESDDEGLRRYAAALEELSSLSAAAAAESSSSPEEDDALLVGVPSSRRRGMMTTTTTTTTREEDEDDEEDEAPSPSLGTPFAEALSRLRAEVDAAKEDVDFCLSLADRVFVAAAAERKQRTDATRRIWSVTTPERDPDRTTTRGANDLSNRLLRAACYGDREDVAAVRADLERTKETLFARNEREAAAYVEALATLATSEERAAVTDSTFATFFLERKAETTLNARLGDAYSVALQRFLGELTRRGAVAGAGFSQVVEARKKKPFPPLGAGKLKSSSNVLLLGESPPAAESGAGRRGLRFNFIDWEMRLRKDLVTSRAKDSERALHPKDFVGTWQIVFVYDSPDAPRPLVASVDPGTLDIQNDETAIEVVFLADGRVVVPEGSGGGPNRWRVRPGPAHLDTCEFDVEIGRDRTVAFCGYVDRGQRIESRFSKRPIKVSGFAYEQQGDDDATCCNDDDQDQDQDDDLERAPSGRFAMLGPVLGNDRAIAPF